MGAQGGGAGSGGACGDDASAAAAVGRMVHRWGGGATARPARAAAPAEAEAAEAEAGATPKATLARTGAAKAGAEAETTLTRTVLLPAKEVPVLTECDVLVVGGGPAGLSAALGAARAGADVVLLERYGCFGGVITTVGMETLGWYRYEGCDDCEGIGREMERVAERMGGSTKWPCNDSQCLDAERFKQVADALVNSSGVRPLLHCLCVDVVRGGPNKRSITGVVTESKSGRAVVLAKTIVDCTGDADVAHLAGVPCRSLPKGERMGTTAVFNVAGVDKERFLNFVSTNPRTYADWSGSDGEWKQATTGKEEALPSPFLAQEFRVAAQKGAISEAEAKELCGSWSALSECGEATNLNLVHMKGYDACDVWDLTRAEMEGRRRTDVALRALRASLPGFDAAKLRNFGMTLGVRDTRKVVGRYDLTEADVRGQARFDDAVGVFPEFIDGYNVLVLPSTGRYFQVPLGCLLPRMSGAESDVDNLLVGGRCVAGDKISHCAMRNMMACCTSGQGAGVAAAVAVRDGVPPQDVDVAAVQAELRRQGVRLD